MPIPNLSSVEGSFLVEAENRSVLRLTGKSLISTLENILSNSVSSITPTDASTAMLLTSKGKPVALFDVSGTDENVEIVTDAGSADGLLKELGRYARVARARLERADASTLTLFGRGAQKAADNVHDALAVREDARGIVTVVVPTKLRGVAVEAVVAAGSLVDSPPDFERRRIAAGVSWGGHEIVPEYFPQELGLTPLVDFTKGCFVGQETMARLKNFGHANRELVRLSMASGAAPVIGAAVTVSGSPVGSVTSSAGGPDPTALAVVRTGAAIEGSDVVVVGGDGRSLAKVHLIPGVRDEGV